MNELQQLLSFLPMPKLYENGSDMMWTDPYIGKQLLKTHLDQNTDMASRKNESIQKTIDWIFSHVKLPKLSILDLGCGPGLYTEKMAYLGHKVAGMDISKYSIEYARNSAKTKGLSIEYLEGDYLSTGFPSSLDLIDIIYCDFGVLSNSEQQALLKKVYQALKPGGIFVMDAFNMNLKPTLHPSRQYEYEEKGFWRDHPYCCLSETFIYTENNAFLDQYVIIDEKISTYRFYNHYFSEEQMISILKAVGFHEVKVGTGVIEDPTVTFYLCIK